MPAGFTYNLNPDAVVEEICDVQTLHHKRGAYKLDTTGLTIGSKLPRFTPVCVNLATRMVEVVKNVKVVEDAAADATSIKVAKNSLVAVGMTLGAGSTCVKVSAIDTSNAAYDTLTVSALGEAVSAGQVLFEAVALVTGKTKSGSKDATSLDIAKGSGVQAGMNIVIGETTYTVTAVDTSNDAKDVLTLSEGLAANVSNNTDFTEAQKSVPAKTANFVIYEETKVENGIVLVALIMRAYEIQEAKLTLPISEKDKESLTDRFQFE